MTGRAYAWTRFGLLASKHSLADRIHDKDRDWAQKRRCTGHALDEHQNTLNSKKKRLLWVL